MTMQRKDITRGKKSQNGIVAGQAARRGMHSRRDRVLGAAVMEALESRLLRSTVAYNGAVQTYTAPLTGLYEIIAAGAEGGQAAFRGFGPGGSGAVLSGDIML